MVVLLGKTMLTTLSVRSPRKLFIFKIYINIFGIKVSKRFYLISETAALLANVLLYSPNTRTKHDHMQCFCSQKFFFLGIPWSRFFHKIMKIHIFWGALSDISAGKEPLVTCATWVFTSVLPFELKYRLGHLFTLKIYIYRITVPIKKIKIEKIFTGSHLSIE